MAITTYAELQTAVANWLHRTDLTSRITEFISLFEARANRVGILRTMEQETDLVGTVDVDYIALPSGFVSPIAAWVVISDIPTPLDMRLPEEFTDITSSIPRFYAIDNANIRFDCPLASNYTVTLRYLKTFALSNSTTTNYLLERAPDAYLYGALAEAAPYMMDDERVPLWESKAQRAITELKRQDARNKQVELRTELTRPRSNIFTG
jgi:hypothetical protein